MQYSNKSSLKIIFPEDHKYLTFLKKVFRHEFRKNGFRRLSTSHIEKTDYFKKVFGEKIDDFIYSFGDYSLKPNIEIANLKAYIEGNLKTSIQPVYTYCLDSFYPKDANFDINEEILFGANVVGEDDPIIDAQLVYITFTILNKIGLSDKFIIKINSLGNKKEQEKYIQLLKDFYENKKHLLTEDGLNKLETNPVLLLSSLNDDEKILAANAPSIIKSLKKDSENHYNSFKGYLDILGISYIEDNTLVSKYNYINNSIWEFSLKETGEIISEGYRYNTLSTILGSDKEIAGSGFAVKVWSLVQILKDNNTNIKNKDRIDLYFVQLGEEAKKVVLPLSLEARKYGINTSVSLGTPSMKEQMLKAQRSGAKFVVMVGIMEARNGVFQVRNVEAGTQEEVRKDNLINYVVEKIGKENLDFYEPSRDLLAD